LTKLTRWKRYESWPVASVVEQREKRLASQVDEVRTGSGSRPGLAPQDLEPREVHPVGYPHPVLTPSPRRSPKESTKPNQETHDSFAIETRSHIIAKPL
jgi:hypothetical protein